MKKDIEDLITTIIIIIIFFIGAILFSNLRDAQQQDCINSGGVWYSGSRFQQGCFYGGNK